jgi:hypothetical protein
MDEINIYLRSMTFEGFLKKMPVALNGDLIQYKLAETIANQWVGKTIQLSFLQEIRCVKCSASIKKTYNDGYCFPCFDSSPENSPCVIRPELCRGHLGEGRDVQWEQENHNQAHVVYLAQTDTVKVGVTRKSNLVNRWIDQGAHKAVIFAETPNRYEAGRIEVAMKDFFTDKTNWRKMLTNDCNEEIDLLEEKWRLENALPQDLGVFFSENDELQILNYPVLKYPLKVQSMQLEKVPLLTKKLMGIRGQYFIFEDGSVLNNRKHSGYKVRIEEVEVDGQLGLF